MYYSTHLKQRSHYPGPPPRILKSEMHLNQFRSTLDKPNRLGQRRLARPRGGGYLVELMRRSWARSTCPRTSVFRCAITFGGAGAWCFSAPHIVQTSRCASASRREASSARWPPQSTQIYFRNLDIRGGIRPSCHHVGVV